MNKYLNRIFDGVSFAAAGIVAADTFIAESAASVLPAPLLADFNGWQPVVAVALLMLPLVRRAATHPSSELIDVARGVAAVGLQQRVVAANHYQNDLPEDHWDRRFPTDEAFWAYFGPVYERPELRAQMNPRLRTRAEAAARTLGVAA